MSRSPRISRVTTRSGDGGTTGLADGSRLAKDAPVIDALGEVDELNANIGLLLSELTDADPLSSELFEIQHWLFDLGGALAVPGSDFDAETATAAAGSRLQTLESWQHAHNEILPPLREFVLPGGTRTVALAHLSRTVCRRAERVFVTMGRESDDSALPSGQVFLNRLSDYLFVIARVLARREDGKETLWRGVPAGERT